MAVRPKSFKCLLGSGLAVVLLAALVSAVPASAASLHQFPNFRSNSGSFNLDQSACPPGMVHRRGTADCYDPQADAGRRNDNSFRSENGPRRPGSSAFGLQFDTGDY
ncbi:MAG: hypothetical protein ABI377_08830 [Devosia sp.]